MLSLTRRLILPLTFAIIHNIHPARRVYAGSLPSVKSLQAFFNEENKKDKINEIKQFRNNLKQCLPVKGYENSLETIDKDGILDLHYILIVYQKPLLEHQKMHIRKKILELYSKSKDDETKKMYINILTYYGLYNTVSP